MVMIDLEDNVVIHLDYEKHRLLFLDFGFDYIVYTLYDEEHHPHIIDLDHKIPMHPVYKEHRLRQDRFLHNGVIVHARELPRTSSGHDRLRRG